MPDDAVDSLVRKYGKKEDAVSDPVDSLVAKYGAKTAAAPDPVIAKSPTPKVPGIVSELAGKSEGERASFVEGQRKANEQEQADAERSTHGLARRLAVDAPVDALSALGSAASKGAIVFNEGLATVARTGKNLVLNAIDRNEHANPLEGRPEDEPIPLLERAKSFVEREHESESVRSPNFRKITEHTDKIGEMAGGIGSSLVMGPSRFSLMEGLKHPEAPVRAAAEAELFMRFQGALGNAMAGADPSRLRAAASNATSAYIAGRASGQSHEEALAASLAFGSKDLMTHKAPAKMGVNNPGATATERGTAPVEAARPVEAPVAPESTRPVEAAPEAPVAPADPAPPRPVATGEARPIRDDIGAVGEQPAKAKPIGTRFGDFRDAFNQRMFQRHMRVAPEAGQEAVSAVDARTYAETMKKIQGDREAAHLREGGVPETVYSDVLDVRAVRHTKEVFDGRAKAEAERAAAAEREAADIKQEVADERNARVEEIENRVKRNAMLARDVVDSTAKQMREVKDYASQKHRDEVVAAKKRIQFEKQQASEHPEDARAQEYAKTKIAEHEAAIKDAATKLRETIRWANGQHREAAKFANDTKFSNQSEEIRGKARVERDAREALRHRKMEIGPDGKRIVTRRALKEVVADMMDAKVKAQRLSEAAAAVRGDQVGKPGSSFKTEADYKAALENPHIQNAIKSRRDFINTRTTPDYLAATDSDPRHQFPVDPILGFHQSMNPLTEEQFSESKSGRLRTDDGIVPGGGTKEARHSAGGPSGPMKMFRRAPRTAQHRTGTSHAYETDFRANLGNQIASARESGAKARYDKALVARGLASWEPGRIENSVAIPVKRFGGENATLFVDRRLKAEVEKVYSADHRADDLGSALSGAFTRINVAANPGEMTTHLKNQFKAVVGSESDLGLPTYVERLANIGAFPVVALVKTARALKILNKPPVERIERLSELGGVLRGRHGDSTVMNKGGNVLIEAHNRIAVYLDAVYDQKVKRGADPSPDARRTFINERLGNYLSGSHGKPFQFLRTYSSPFLVAKTTQASMGVKQLTTGQGLSNLAGVAVATYVMSWILTGKEPPKDAPIGSVPWKTADGKTHYIDLANFTPVGRLARSGAGAIVEGKRAGLSNNAVAGDAGVAVARQVEDAFMGPWTQFLEETMTGKDYAGQPTNKANPKHPDGVQLAMNAIYALADTNPIAGAVFHTAVGDTEKAHESYERFSPVKEGKGEKYVENLPRIRESQEIKAFEEDAFRRMAKAKETHDADEIARVRKAIKAEADALKKKFAK